MNKLPSLLRTNPRTNIDLTTVINLLFVIRLLKVKELILKKEEPRH